MWHAGRVVAVSGDDRQEMAQRVIGQVSTSVVGRELDGVTVAAVFWYGAVDIDPRHLVVWVLLSGKPADQLPKWLMMTPRLPRHLRPQHVDYDWLLGLHAEIVTAFAAVGWPDPENIAVNVDSAHRVEAAGGWSYFR